MKFTLPVLFVCALILRIFDPMSLARSSLIFCGHYFGTYWYIDILKGMYYFAKTIQYIQNSYDITTVILYMTQLPRHEHCIYS